MVLLSASSCRSSLQFPLSHFYQQSPIPDLRAVSALLHFQSTAPAPAGDSRREPERHHQSRLFRSTSARCCPPVRPALH